MNAAAEATIASYIRGHRDESAHQEQSDVPLDLACNRGGTLECLPIYEGRITDNRVASSVVVEASQAPQEFDFEPWARVTVRVTLHTHRHEDDDNIERPEVIHNQRAQELWDLLCDSAAIKTWCNDTENRERGVSRFYTMSAVIINNEGEIMADTMRETIELELYCQPLNVPVS